MAPTQTMEDFLANRAQWNLPYFQGEDTMRNRVRLNLCYYQVNYFNYIYNALAMQLFFIALGLTIQFLAGQEISAIQDPVALLTIGLGPTRFISFWSLKIFFHAVFRMPNLKENDRGIYYHRILSKTFLAQILQFFHLAPNFQNIRFRLMSAPGQPLIYQPASTVPIQTLRIY